jgi:uncharacterized RDD family membrane protein YckC
MSTQPPPPGEGSPDGTPHNGNGEGDRTGSPYDNPYGSRYGAPPPPPYDPNAFGGGYGGRDPLAGMPPLGSLGRRLLARLLDLLLITVPITLISLPFGGTGMKMNNGDGGFNNVVTNLDTGHQWVWTVITAVALVLYEWLMVRRTGQTVGKRILRLRVAALSDGSTPASSPALVRAAVLLLPAWLCCPCLWWLVIVGWVVLDKPYRQGPHDKAAKTVVVSVT